MIAVCGYGRVWTSFQPDTPSDRYRHREHKGGKRRGLDDERAEDREQEHEPEHRKAAPRNEQRRQRLITCMGFTVTQDERFDLAHTPSIETCASKRVEKCLKNP
jgi:hypothetical protein